MTKARWATVLLAAVALLLLVVTVASRRGPAEKIDSRALAKVPREYLLPGEPVARAEVLAGERRMPIIKWLVAVKQYTNLPSLAVWRRFDRVLRSGGFEHNLTGEEKRDDYFSMDMLKPAGRLHIEVYLYPTPQGPKKSKSIIVLSQITHDAFSQAWSHRNQTQAGSPQPPD